MAKNSLLADYKRGFAMRHAARSRLPVWLGLSMPLVGMASVAAIATLLISVSLKLRQQLGAAAISSDPSAQGLIFLGSFAAALIPGMMLANVLLWLIPPVRRRLNKNGADESGSAFRRNMMTLAKICCFSIPVGVVPLAIGIFVVA